MTTECHDAVGGFNDSHYTQISTKVKSMGDTPALVSVKFSVPADRSRPVRSVFQVQGHYLSGQYRLSLPTAVPIRVWEAAESATFYTISQSTRSDKRLSMMLNVCKTSLCLT